MKIENADLGYTCSVPDRPTVRQQLAYYEAIGNAAGAQSERYWEGAKTLISNWSCPELPEPGIDLDQIDNPRQAAIVVDAGTKILRHMNSLENIPKN